MIQNIIILYYINDYISETLWAWNLAVYLKDSTSFLVDLTKKGKLSFLVTSTKPPLLSMTPWWIAARQILDCCKNQENKCSEKKNTCCNTVGNFPRLQVTYHIIKQCAPHSGSTVLAVGWAVIPNGNKKCFSDDKSMLNCVQNNNLTVF